MPDTVDLQNVNAPDYVKAAKARANALPPEEVQALIQSQHPFMNEAGLDPNEAGAPPPDFFKASVSVPNGAVNGRTELPPELNGVIGALPGDQRTLPPVAPKTLEDKAMDVAGNGPAPLAPQRQKTLGEKVLPFLKLAGAIGGGLEASGHPMQEPEGAKMFEQELQHEQGLALEKAKLAQVEAPLAQAHANYFNQFNPTKLGVAQTNVAGKTTVADIQRADHWDVARLKAEVTMGRVTRVEDGIDPETGNPLKLAYNGAGQLIGRLDNSLASPGYYPKSTSTTQYMPNESGKIEALPKNTTTGPVLPRLSQFAPGTPGAPAQAARPGLPVSGGRFGTPVGAPGVPGTTPLAAPAVRPGAIPAGRTGAGGPRPIQARPVLDAEGNSMHKPLDAEQQKNLQQIYTTQGMIQSVLPDLQSVVNDMQHGGTLQDTAKVRAAWQIYSKLGLDPSNVDPNSLVATFRDQFGLDLDPRLARIFPTLAMVQVVGIQPFLRGIRNMDYVHQIQQHLPNPERDSPDFMLNKLQQLDRNLPIAVNALKKAAGVSPAAGGGTNTPTPKGGGKKIDLTQFDHHPAGR